MDHRKRMLKLLDDIVFDSIESVTKQLNTEERFVAMTEHGALDGSTLLKISHFGPIVFRSNPYIIPSVNTQIIGKIEDGAYVWWMYANKLKILHRIITKNKSIGVWIRSRRIVSMLEIDEMDTMYGLLCCIYGFWDPFVDPKYRHPYVKDGYVRRNGLRVPYSFLSAAALFLKDDSIPQSHCELMAPYQEDITRIETETILECTCTC